MDGYILNLTMFCILVIMSRGSYVQEGYVYPRLPCGKCFAPYHTTGFCRANPTHLARAQNKHTRFYDGPLPQYQVGEAVQYHHSDGDSLQGFLTTLQGEIEAELGAVEGVSLKVVEENSEQDDTKVKTAAEANTTGTDVSNSGADAGRQDECTDATHGCRWLQCRTGQICKV